MINKRSENLQASGIASISQEANRLKKMGMNVINLSVGEPDFNTPENVKKAGISAIKDNYTRYTDQAGSLELRGAICDAMQRDYNMSYKPENITVSSGAKHAISNLLAVTIDDGDEVILLAPYWTSYKHIVNWHGGNPVIVPLSTDWSIDIDAIDAAITKNTKWIMVNSPNNPTGSLLARENLEDLANLLRKHRHVGVISDDIYSAFTNNFVNLPMIAPDLKERYAIINGLSKSHAMTGWRIGFTAATVEIATAMARLQSQTFGNPCSISQKAAIEALAHPIPHHDYSEKRRVLIDSLPKEFKVEGNDAGAFYLFPNCQEVIALLEGCGVRNDVDLVHFILQKALVATVPGSIFGAPNHIRISYACTIDTLVNAGRAISEMIQKVG